MCGITGIVLKTGGVPERTLLQRMNDAVAHRGPDGEGLFIEGSVGLGHRRLSILDLSPLGAQPMYSPDKRYVITYNGEVYNYLELRSELTALGHVFRSGTDTEVILAAYSQWGPSCLHRFNGMWAFAIYDRLEKTVFCARDRFGVKPFYYYDNSGIFAFGSEIRQLLIAGSSRQPNLGKVLEFVITGLSDTDENTFFTTIKKLQAGCYLTYQLDTNRFAINRYYHLVPDRSVKLLKESEQIERLDHLMTDAVRLRLRSDVPVGTCLSGGLDSSTIASIAAPIYEGKSGRQFHAITAVSTDRSNDESEYARIVAEKSRMCWLRTTPSYDDFRDILDKVTRVQEEPFGGASVVMQYFVMQTAREHKIPVLLDGQGADETLLGYNKYFGRYLQHIYRDYGALSAASELVRAASTNPVKAWRNIARHVVGAVIPNARFVYQSRCHRYLKEKPISPPSLRDYCNANINVQEFQTLEITRTNLPVLLRFEDKNSMAHSVETRLPFLDYRVVEFCLSLPPTIKIRNGWTKWILRELNSKYLPRSIAWRRDKIGFAAPTASWYALHRKQMITDISCSRLLRELARTGTNWDNIANRLTYMEINGLWRLSSVAAWENTI